MRAPTATFGRLRSEVRDGSAKELAQEVIRAYTRNDLLTAASAIAFQVLFALIPFMLFLLALVGALQLESLWTQHAAPPLEDTVSPAGFAVLEATVDRILGAKQGFWITIGAAIAVWEISGAMRTVMNVVDRVYGAKRERTFKERYWTSIWLSVAVGVLLLAAFAVFAILPLFTGWFVSVLRWPAAALVLFGAIYLVVHFAPSDPQPVHWVSFGAALVVVAWLGTSIAFAFYATNIAQYGSVFGALATVIVVFTYVYISSIAFLTGLQADALVRKRAE